MQLRRTRIRAVSAKFDLPRATQACRLHQFDYPRGKHRILTILTGSTGQKVQEHYQDDQHPPRDRPDGIGECACSDFSGQNSPGSPTRPNTRDRCNASKLSSPRAQLEGPGTVKFPIILGKSQGLSLPETRKSPRIQERDRMKREAIGAHRVSKPGNGRKPHTAVQRIKEVLQQICDQNRTLKGRREGT